MGKEKSKEKVTPKNKKRMIHPKENDKEENATAGLPEVDFKKFLGCGG